MSDVWVHEGVEYPLFEGFEEFECVLWKRVRDGSLSEGDYIRALIMESVQHG